MNINERQVRYLGHLISKRGLEHPIRTAKIEGNRAQKRQRKKHIDDIKEMTGRPISHEIFHMTDAASRWRSEAKGWTSLKKKISLEVPREEDREAPYSTQVRMFLE